MPSDEAVRRALATIGKRAANYEYIFERLDAPDWMDPLRAAGFFQKPPPAVRTGDMISFPGWPETRYLARVAPQVPDAVLDVLLKLPETDNFRVHDELVTVALALPAPLAARWAKREARWLATQTSFYFLPEHLGQLVVHLASGGEGAAALQLARRVFEVAPDTGSSIVRDVRVKMADWEYGDILRRLCPILVATTGEDGLQFFLNLLAEALKASGDERNDGYSWTWRPAIEDHEQNSGHRPLDDIVASARDAAKSVITAKIAPAARVGSSLLDRGGLFARIGLYALAEVGVGAEDLVARCIGDRSLFDNIDMRHEYDALSEAWFGHVPEATRQAVLAWIDAGPGEDRIARWRERAMTEDTIRVDVQRWERDRLYPLRDALPQSWAKRYVELVAATGQPERPDFTLHRRTWVGPTTPKSADELRSMSLDDLVLFLAEWKPKNDWMEPTEEGLGRKVEEVVGAEPARFAADCERFATLDVTYVRSVIAGFAAAVRAGRSFDWPPVLRLCVWVVEQPREILGRSVSQRMDRDPDWGWSRKQIADLLVRGLEARDTAIPREERSRVWSLLEALIRDPDPDASFNEQSSMDVLSQALNTVRGQTMHAVMNYALWVHRRSPSDHEVEADLGLVTEVAALLDRELDPVAEPADAVRGVYGRWLWVLAHLDTKWVRSRLDRIFPEAIGLVGLRLAAWESYLGSTRPDAKLFDLLQAHYRWAVSSLGSEAEVRTRRHFVKPDERLAEHLMIIYWHGEIALEGGDGLLDEFYRKATAKLREHAFSFVGRCLHGTPKRDLVPAVDAKLRALFERRLAIASAQPDTHATELRGFPWWFSADALDLDWRFTQLKRVLAVSPMLEGDFLVMEELVRHAEQRPAEVLECVELLLRTENPWHLVVGSRARFEAILSMSVSSEKTDVREKAVALIHRLGSLGHSDLRRIIPRTERPQV
jgi:hypothetical protein